MLDIKVIRENVKEVKQAMLNRNLDISFDQLLNWDSERKTIIDKTEQLRLKRNKESKEMGRLKRESKEPPAELLAEINKIRNIIQEQEKQLFGD